MIVDIKQQVNNDHQKGFTANNDHQKGFNCFSNKPDHVNTIMLDKFIKIT